MQPPLLIDIPFADLWFAWRATWGTRDPELAATALAGVESAWSRPDRAVACLSVRSGWDLLLRALALPPGTAVLMTGFTIPHMAEIVRRHELRVVAVDLDLETLAPDLGHAADVDPGGARAFLHAHLFGARADLTATAAFCRERGLLLVEDCAQAFTGSDFAGDPAADVSMFSFGTIKTATALGGAVLDVADDDLRRRMRALRDDDPLRPPEALARRARRIGAIRALSSPWAYGALLGAIRIAGVDHAELLRRSVRGFAGDDVLAAVRQRPSRALCQTLARRLRQEHEDRVATRADCGERLASALDGEPFVPGRRAPVRTHWVFPVVVPDPRAAIAALRRVGLDAPRAATVRAVGTPAAPECTRLDRGVVYVPLPRRPSHRRLAGIARALRV